MNNYVWPVSSGRITSYFGDTRDGGSRSHAGIDIAVPVGTDVYSIAPGVVSNTGYTSARGNYITVDHGSGVSSLYEHLSGYAATIGQNVAAGDLIAKSGNSGQGTGPHLHFEIKTSNGYVDPLQYSFSGSGSAAAVNESGVNNMDGIIEAIKKYWYVVAAGMLIFAVISK